MESLQNCLQTHYPMIPLWSMRAMSQVSSQPCYHITGAWCKGALSLVEIQQSEMKNVNEIP